MGQGLSLVLPFATETRFVSHVSALVSIQISKSFLQTSKFSNPTSLVLGGMR